MSKETNKIELLKVNINVSMSSTNGIVKFHIDPSIKMSTDEYLELASEYAMILTPLLTQVNKKLEESINRQFPTVKGTLQ